MGSKVDLCCPSSYMTTSLERLSNNHVTIHPNTAVDTHCGAFKIDNLIFMRKKDILNWKPRNYLLHITYDEREREREREINI